MGIRALRLLENVHTNYNNLSYQTGKFIDAKQINTFVVILSWGHIIHKKYILHAVQHRGGGGGGILLVSILKLEVVKHLVIVIRFANQGTGANNLGTQAMGAHIRCLYITSFAPPIVVSSSPVDKELEFFCSVTSRCLHHLWLISKWTIGNKLQWNLNQISQISITNKNVVRKKMTIVSRSPWFKELS